MKLTVTTFITLDGVMQAPGGPQEDASEGFTHGGWQFPYIDDDFGGIVTDIISRADAFLLGRKTYDIFAGYWPDHNPEGDPIANPLNALPKYVASRTLPKADWTNSTIIEGEVIEVVRDLKSQDGRELQVWGSGNLIQALMKNDLVDEYNLFTHPIILGTGKKLFASGATTRALELVSSQTSSNGVTFANYRTAGEPRYGTVGE